MQIRDYMEIIQYKITEGSDFLWYCYGNNAFQLDSYTDDYCISIIFDTKTQVVYQTEAHDYKNERSYRWFNSEFKDLYFNESNRRKVNAKYAYDDIYFVDLETEEDFITKSSSMVNNVEYDTRVEIPLNLQDDNIFELMKLAHLHDITLNQLVEKLLKEEIEKLASQ